MRAASFLRIWHASPGRWLAASITVFLAVAIAGAILGVATQRQVGSATRRAEAVGQAVSGVRQAYEDTRSGLRRLANGDHTADAAARSSAARLVQAATSLDGAPLGGRERAAAARVHQKLDDWVAGSGAPLFGGTAFSWDPAIASLASVDVDTAIAALESESAEVGQAELAAAMRDYGRANRVLVVGGTLGIALALGAGFIAVRRLQPEPEEDGLEPTEAAVEVPAGAG